MIRAEWYNKKHHINHKRALKHKRLIRKLAGYYINKAIKENNLIHKTIFRIIDKDYLGIGSSKVTHLDNGNHKITIDLPSLYKDRVKHGYVEPQNPINRYKYLQIYYGDRLNRLNFVKGNKHIALRFVILHELGHAILRDTGENTEFNADNYAIEQLQKEGLLKRINEIQLNEHIEDYTHYADD